MYKFKAKNTKIHWIDANNWSEAEREFLDHHVIENAGDAL